MFSPNLASFALCFIVSVWSVTGFRLNGVIIPTGYVPPKRSVHIVKPWRPNAPLYSGPRITPYDLMRRLDPLYDYPLRSHVGKDLSRMTADPATVQTPRTMKETKFVDEIAMHPGAVPDLQDAERHLRSSRQLLFENGLLGLGILTNRNASQGKSPRSLQRTPKNGGILGAVAETFQQLPKLGVPASNSNQLLTSGSTLLENTLTTAREAVSNLPFLGGGNNNSPLFKNGIFGNSVATARDTVKDIADNLVSVATGDLNRSEGLLRGAFNRVLQLPKKAREILVGEQTIF